MKVIRKGGYVRPATNEYSNYFYCRECKSCIDYDAGEVTIERGFFFDKCFAPCPVCERTTRFDEQHCDI